MIALALLLLQVTPAVEVSDEVVVTAQRLERAWGANFRYGKKGFRCDVKRSTGDAELDRVGCAALEACAPTFQSRLAGTDDRAIRPEVKKMMRTALNQEFAACVTRERRAGITALLARRKGS